MGRDIYVVLVIYAANEGLVLYIGRDYGLHLDVVLLVQYVSR